MVVDVMWDCELWGLLTLLQYHWLDDNDTHTDIRYIDTTDTTNTIMFWHNFNS